MASRRPGADHPRATRRYAADEIGPSHGKAVGPGEGTTEFEERIDGVIAAGSVSSLRDDRIPSVVRDEDAIMLCLHGTAAEEMWEVAEIVRDYLPAKGPGRPRKCGIADMILYLILTEIFGAMSDTELLLRNPDVWAAMRQVAASAWPFHPERRLHENAPDRFQVYRLRETYLRLPEVRARIYQLNLSIAAKQALLMGQFNPEVGSDTHPHRFRFAVGDGTWELAASNAGPDPILDPRTGELRVRRHDPGAYPFHNNTRSRGNMWTMVSAPGPFPGTSVIFGGRFTNSRSEQDSDVALDIVLELQQLLPGLQGLVHDKAATAKHHDRAADHRLLVINGVPRAKGGKVAYANLGKYLFRKPDRSEFHNVLWTVNGHPAIEAADERGKQFILLTRKKNQWNEPRKKDEGRYALYVEWEVPDHPLIPTRQHGAIVRVRHNSTDDQLAAGKRAGTHLRAIPEDDPDFPELAGIRQLAESLNHKMKQGRPNKRARAYGLDNRTVHNYAFIMASNMMNMIQWYRYTGGDISTRFGQYRPPEPTRKSNRPGAA